MRARQLELHASVLKPSREDEGQSAAWIYNDLPLSCALEWNVPEIVWQGEKGTWKYCKL